MLVYSVLPKLPDRDIQAAALVLFPAAMPSSEIMTSDDVSDVSHRMLRKRIHQPL